MNSPDSEVPYGTLDLMVLKTLAGMGPLHGYGIARRIEQAAGRRQLTKEAKLWERTVSMVNRLLEDRS